MPALREAVPLPPHAEAAERRAVAIRAEIDRRPDDAVIRAWLDYVALAVARPRPTEDDIVAMIGILLDGEYPAAVFNPTTRREAARRFKHWPSAAEVWELLAPHIEAMGVELPGLDRAVHRARYPVAKAREAIGYDPGPATPEVKLRRRPLRELGDIDRVTRDDPKEAEAEDAAARESARKQLATLAELGVVAPPRVTPDKPAPARIVTVNRKPIAKPEPSPLPPVRRRPRAGSAWA